MVMTGNESNVEELKLLESKVKEVSEFLVYGEILKQLILKYDVSAIKKNEKKVNKEITDEFDKYYRKCKDFYNKDKSIQDIVVDTRKIIDVILINPSYQTTVIKTYDVCKKSNANETLVKMEELRKKVILFMKQLEMIDYNIKIMISHEDEIDKNTLARMIFDYNVLLLFRDINITLFNSIAPIQVHNITKVKTFDLSNYSISEETIMALFKSIFGFCSKISYKEFKKWLIDNHEYLGISSYYSEGSFLDGKVYSKISNIAQQKLGVFNYLLIPNIHSTTDICSSFVQQYYVSGIEYIDEEFCKLITLFMNTEEIIGKERKRLIQRVIDNKQECAHIAARNCYKESEYCDSAIKTLIGLFESEEEPNYDVLVTCILKSLCSEGSLKDKKLSFVSTYLCKFPKEAMQIIKTILDNCSNLHGPTNTKMECTNIDGLEGIDYENNNSCLKFIFDNLIDKQRVRINTSEDKEFIRHILLDDNKMDDLPLHNCEYENELRMEMKKNGKRE